MSNRPANRPRRPDPYASWRALDGKVITVATHQLHEDADGMPLGVERTSEYEGLLVLPSLPEQEDE